MHLIINSSLFLCSLDVVLEHCKKTRKTSLISQTKAKLYNHEVTQPILIPKFPEFIIYDMTNNAMLLESAFSSYVFPFLIIQTPTNAIHQS